VQRLIGIFGKSLGTYFHDAALGIDDEPVKERGEVESISRISTSKEDTRNLDAILDDANKLCDDVHAALKQRGYSFKSVGIVMVMTNMSIRSRSKTLEKPTNDLEALKKATGELLAKFLEESELEVRRVGVRISSFVETQKSQKSLADFIS
jgi:DNA polymerase IV (DinB-like DNA polymerase)